MSKQIPRQWRMLRRLENHRFGLTAVDLAEHEGCPVRTIFRDLNDLQDAGFPLESEKRGRQSFWRLSEYHRNQGGVPFEYTEACALWIARGLMNSLQGTSFYEDLSSAFEKIHSNLPPGMLEHFEEFEHKVMIRHSREQDFSGSHSILQLLNQGLENEQTVKLSYFSPQRDEETKRKVDPYHLLLQDQVMYLIGYCHLRKGIRTFHMARIKEVELVEDMFFSIQKDFSLEQYLSGNFRTMAGEIMKVEVLFDRSVRHIPIEQKWHPTQEIVENGDGSVTLHFNAGGMSEIKGWLLGFGSKVKVLQPPELIEAIRSDLLKAIENYS